MCETHNGHVNRETWCMSLHLSNDPIVYEMMMDIARNGVLAESPDYRIGWVASEIKWAIREVAGDIGEALTHPVSIASNLIAKAILDTGSLYRVDWRAIAESFLDDVLEDAKD